jgi:hypothetical protein
MTQWKFTPISKIIEFLKTHHIIEALIHVHFNREGVLTVSKDLSAISGFGFDAEELQELLINGNWAIEDFGIQHVGTYTVQAIYELDDTGYTCTDFEVIAQVH